MPSTPHAIPYRPDIDGMRAIAVLTVVVFHAFPMLVPGGFVGVDIFFVISGYLISTIIFKALAAGTFSFMDFYQRRARRILPPLVVVIAATLIIGWSVLLPDEYAELGKHSLAGLGFVANIVLWQEAGYFDSAAEFKPLLHLWSLGVEEQFYIFWPLILACAWRIGLSLWMTIGVIAVLSFVLNILLTATAPSAAYFLLHTRAWEMLIGAALAWAVFKGHRLGLDTPRARDLASMAGLIMVLAALVLVDKDSMFPGWWALLPTLGAALIIAAGPNALVNKKLLSIRLLVFIGLISFPLYLWHWPLLTFVRIVQGESVSVWLLTAAIVVSVLLSWASYYFLETPLRQSKRWLPMGLLVAFGLLVALGSHNIYSRDGLNFRLKDAQAKSEAQALEWPTNLRSADGCTPERLSGAGVDCLVMSDSLKANAVIIGDSHANHYYWALSHAFKGSDINLLQLAEGGCPPLYGLDFLDKGVVVPCSQSIDPIIQHVVDDPDLETVFVAGRWVGYMTGRDLDDPRDHVSDESIYIGEPAADDQSRRVEIFSQALAASLDMLSTSGKKIVFLHAVPELPFNARECVSWSPNRYISRVPRETCGYDRAIADERAAEYRPQLDVVLARYPMIAQFDPMPFICAEAQCLGRQDGVLLYRDDDHLSLDGAYWLGEKIAPRVHDLMGTGSSLELEEQSN